MKLLERKDDHERRLKEQADTERARRRDHEPSRQKPPTRQEYERQKKLKKLNLPKKPKIPDEKRMKPENKKKRPVVSFPFSYLETAGPEFTRLTAENIEEFLLL